MDRRLPSLLSLALLALCLGALALTWQLGRVSAWQGLKAQVWDSAGESPLYQGVWPEPLICLEEPLRLRPKRPFRLRLHGYLHVPQAGLWQVALLASRPLEASLAGARWASPDLSTEPRPPWRVQAELGGDAAPLALDRDPATRWSTGRAQQGGESYTVYLGEQRPVLGVILDSAASPQDNPARLSVALSGNDKGYTPVASLGARGPGLSRVELFFRPFQASSLRLEQGGRHPVFYWSVHELHVVDEEMLGRRARVLELAAQAQALELILPARREPALQAGERPLLGVFVKPPGLGWQMLPASWLSQGPQGGSPLWAELALLLGPWLWPVNMLLLAVLAGSLYRDWLWPRR